MRSGRVMGGWVASLVIVGVAPCAMGQLRMAAWNISNYGGGRTADIQASVYGVFESRSMAPDAFVLQEFLSAGAVTSFVSALNSAPGSPGDWVGALFVDGPDTDSAFVYRTSRLELLGTTVVAVGGVAPNHPRNIMRYDVRPVGYASASAVIACYSTHMKSGSGSGDQARRLVEAQRIRDDAEALPAGWNFLLGGDFNIQSSAQAAYIEMVGSQANDAGRFFDPINTPGPWNNSFGFRFVHTQDPIGAGGMDDRHDQILISQSLMEPNGLAYIGPVDPISLVATPYSTTTWNDPNHSYRSWGNDGSTFNSTLRIVGNAMVGPTIAQALVNMCVGAGHLPVFLDLRVPAKADSEPVIDFGTVVAGSAATASIEIINAGDTALWTATGIDPLSYSLSASAGFGAPSGDFEEPAGGAGNLHTLTMDTSSPGVLSGTLTISSDDPDQPERLVVLMGEVVPDEPDCPGDLNGDNIVDTTDLNIVLSDFGCAASCAGDIDGDGDVDTTDLNILLSAFGQSCR